MKVIQNESYLYFVKRILKTFFTDSANLIYVAFTSLGIAVYWYEDGFESMLRVIIMLINAFVIMLFFVEFLSTVISKEIDKNNIISELVAICILTLISFVFYDEKFRYWSFVLSLMLFIPIIINIIFSKIRFWLNL
nr:hypothetical protein [uncultured Flavobacterium sp.]